METLETLLIIVFFIVCVLLVLAVLMQSNRGGGLSGMLGGGSASQNPFGSSASDVMGKITRWLGFALFVICIGFSAIYYERPVTADEVKEETEFGDSKFLQDEDDEDKKDKDDETGAKGKPPVGKKDNNQGKGKGQ